MTSQRITIPEGHVALVIPRQLAEELHTVAQLMRGKRKWSTVEKNSIQLVGDSLLLALVDAGINSL